MLAESKKERIEYDCDSKGEAYSDQIRYKVETDKESSSLKVIVEYKQQQQQQQQQQYDAKDDGDEERLLSTQQQETNYEIVFDRVIEYRKAKTEDPVTDPPQPSIEFTRQSGAIQDLNNDYNETIAISNTTTQETDEDDTRSGDTESFDWENDEILQERMLDNWNSFSEIQDDGSLIRFSVSSKDDLTSFFFTIARETSVESNVTATANKMKIDFELQNFPWVSEDSYVALLTTVQSLQRQNVLEEESSFAAKKKVEISFQGVSLDTLPYTPMGEYTWKSEAQAISRDAPLEGDQVNIHNDTESETIRVIATSPDDTLTGDSSNQQQIAFSFLGESAKSARDIYWDPSAGVAYESGAGTATVLFGYLSGRMATLAFALFATASSI